MCALYSVAREPVLRREGEGTGVDLILGASVVHASHVGELFGGSVMTERL